MLGRSDVPIVDGGVRSTYGRASAPNIQYGPANPEQEPAVGAAGERATVGPVSDGAELEDLRRLRENIADELRAQLALLGRPMTSDDVEDVAQAVAVNLDYAFRTEWAPRWEGRRE